ncbi:MAG: hypothetical protein ACOVNL_09120 [Prochlorococcaceae cyanobacterium]|jgi:hypothetical protein
MNLACPSNLSGICQHVFYAAHRDAGFFIYSLNQFYGGVLTQESSVRIRTCNIDTISDDDIDSLSAFSLVIPLQDAHRANRATFSCLTRESLVNALNDLRCTLVIDFSNESCDLALLGKLNSLLIDFGVRQPCECGLLSQNRKTTMTSEVNGILKPFIFDFFPLATITSIFKAVSDDEIELLVSSRTSISKPGDYLCLNATPRLHRIITLLLMIEAGLINKSKFLVDSTPQIPYISFPGIEYSKSSGLNEEQVREAVKRLGLEDKDSNLDWLLSVSPLRVDTLTEEGNQLATKVVLDHYYNTNISVITETGTDNLSKRITEKTIKPLALGHPCVIIGHPESVQLARELGFSAMDHVINHDYDSEINPIRRTQEAIISAKVFIDKIHTQEILPASFRDHAKHNIHWAKDGFKRFYYNHYIRPILRFMRLE